MQFISGRYGKLLFPAPFTKTYASFVEADAPGVTEAKSWFMWQFEHGV